MSNHLAKKTLKMMTVKEVAAVLNVSTDLVKKRIRELFPDKMVNGVKTYLTEKEVTAIKLRIEQNSSLATYDDRNRLSEMPKTNLEKELIIQQAMIYQQEKIQSMELELEDAKRTIKLQAPKVALAEDSIRDKDTHYSITEAGKQLGLKQKFIFDLMRKKRLLTVENIPTQHALNRNFLTLRTNIVNGKNRPQAVMTMENIYNFKNSYEKDFA